MRLLLVTQYFWPEFFIINDLVSTLVKQGHSVEVLTGKPNYPDGNIFEGYSSNGCVEEYFEGVVKVHRVPIYPRGSGGAKKLFRNYASFVYNGLKYFHGMVKGKSFDAILVFAPSPVTQLIPAIYLKYRLKSHLAFWVQDLWPESLKATGFVQNRLLLWLVGVLVRLLYTFTDTLLIQSRAFYKPVLKYAKEKKIEYYPNSFKQPESELPQNTQLSDEIITKLENNFCIVFAGNLGIAQSLETLLQAAECLQHLSKLRLIVVGSGSQEKWLRNQIETRSIGNIDLVGRYPAHEMPQFFTRAEGLLVTLKREDVFSFTIPGKVQAYLAAGRPVIAALDGEGAKVIEEAKAGFTCPAEDGAALAEKIERLYYCSIEERSAMAKAARSYYLYNFEMESQAKRLIEILKNRINLAQAA